MKTRAAILVELHRPLVVEDIDIPPPGPGQYLIEIAFSGVCHTQVLEARGKRGPDPWLPHCMGHEGSGRVLAAGPGTGRFRPGDEVVLSWLKGRGADARGSLYGWNGKEVNAGPITTFMLHALISENRLTPVPPTMDLPTAALLGCAIPTGFGAVFKSGGARPGNSVAVFGAGGIGLCAIAAARFGDCDPIIAADRHEAKLKPALSLGATHAINVTHTDVATAIQEIVPGGVHLTIEATGSPAMMGLALSVVRDRGGRAVIVGNAPHGASVSVDPQLFNRGRSLVGTWGGDCDPEVDYPRFAEMITGGMVKIKSLIAGPYRLDHVNQVLSDLESGQIARPLIDMAMG